MKYNWDLIGHSNIKNFFEAALEADKIEHAYFFYGASKLGKRLFAKRLAQLILCAGDGNNKQNLPCLKCEACRQFSKGVHADYHLLKRVEDKQNITIEQIRELQKKLSGHAFFKNYKVVIIEEADSLSLEASNALLKSLEEPRPKTIIILLAEKTSQLPSTILSRTQKIKFLPVEKESIYNYLIEKGAQRNMARDIANLSQGAPGRAIDFFSTPQMWQTYLAQLKVFVNLSSASFFQRFDFCQKMFSADKVNQIKLEKAKSLLNFWLTLARDLMLFKMGQNVNIINTAGEENLKKVALKYSLEELYAMQKNIIDSRQDLQNNANPKLVLENFLINL